ncbi:glutamate racemase [Gemmatimonadota bacterium]
MIGIFDSGVGGLSILRELDCRLPDADILYLSDNACFPYGCRPPGWIRERAAAITRAFLERDCRLVVVACNTATVTAIESLRENFPIPFVGIVPPLKPAVTDKPEKPVVVLMTDNTAEGAKYTELAQAYAGNTRVEEIRLPELAQVVEELKHREPEVIERLAQQIHSSLGEENRGFRVVLGCTHYVFLRPLLEERLGPEVEVLDPCEAVASQVLRVCEQQGITTAQSGERKFFCTGDKERFAGQIKELLGIDNPRVERMKV